LLVGHRAGRRATGASGCLGDGKAKWAVADAGLARRAVAWARPRARTAG